MTYLLTLQKTQFAVPKVFGLVHRKNADQLNLRSFYISKDYIDPFVKSLALSDQLKILDIRRTQLTMENAKKLVLHIPEQLQQLDISFNPAIGPLSIKELCDTVLLDIRYRLETLKVEDCNIGDKGAEYLSIALINTYSKLKLLDISKNNITHKGAKFIGDSLDHNRYLTVLFMHWNKLGSLGGKHLA